MEVRVLTIEEEKMNEFRSAFQEIENEIGKAIIGQKDIIENVLVAIVAGGNVLLEGLPGLGKTQLVKTIGKVLDLSFNRIQFTPDLMPADVTGTNVIFKNPDGNSEYKFQKGPIFTNIVLADEINRATPKTQSALLEAMQEHTVTIGMSTYKMEEPFFVLATQNPIEMEGTYPLPEAQMDRFMFKLDVQFPNKEDLKQIVNITTGVEQEEPSKVVDGEKVLSMRAIAKQIPISSAVSDFAIDIILKTHPEIENAPEITKRYIRYGASPRAAQAIITAARIYALLDGRFNVAFDDIKRAAYPTLRHRIFINFEALADGMTQDAIIESLISLS